MQCQAIKSNKTRCNAHALHYGEYCFRHDKKAEKRAAEASSTGGKGNRQYIHLGNRMRIKTPSDVKFMMEKALNALWTGKMPSPNPAGSLGYLAKIFLEAHDKSELELRVEALEKKLENKST